MANQALRFPGGSLSDDYHWATNTTDSNTWQWATSFTQFAQVATATGAQVFIPQSNGELYNPQSGKCLDDTGYGGSGTQLQIWACADTSNQQWSLP